MDLFSWHGQKKAYYASSSHRFISEDGDHTTFVPFQLVASYLVLNLGLKMQSRPKFASFQMRSQPFGGLYTGKASVQPKAAFFGKVVAFRTDRKEVLSYIASDVSCLILLYSLWVILNKYKSFWQVTKYFECHNQVLQETSFI